MNIKVFSVWLCILTIGDIATTKIALRNEAVYECNVIMDYIVHNLYLFVGVKTIGVIIVIILSNWCIKRDESIGKIGMYIILIMYVLICLNNLYWIFKVQLY